MGGVDPMGCWVGEKQNCLRLPACECKRVCVRVGRFGMCCSIHRIYAPSQAISIHLNPSFLSRLPLNHVVTLHHYTTVDLSVYPWKSIYKIHQNTQDQNLDTALLRLHAAALLSWPEKRSVGTTGLAVRQGTLLAFHWHMRRGDAMWYSKSMDTVFPLRFATWTLGLETWSLFHTYSFLIGLDICSTLVDFPVSYVVYGHSLRWDWLYRSFGEGIRTCILTTKYFKWRLIFRWQFQYIHIRMRAGPTNTNHCGYWALMVAVGGGRSLT